MRKPFLSPQEAECEEVLAFAMMNVTVIGVFIGMVIWIFLCNGLGAPAYSWFVGMILTGMATLFSISLSSILGPAIARCYTVARRLIK